MYGEIDGFLETFKYALKFSDLELSDNLHAYKTLKGKRLINSFGALRGVEVPEELTDDDLDDDLPLHADALHIPQRVRLQFFRAMDRGLIMKYYIKSAKGYWLTAQGNGYTKTKAKPMLSLSTKYLQFAFNLDGCTLSDNP